MKGTEMKKKVKTKIKGNKIVPRGTTIQDCTFHGPVVKIDHEVAAYYGELLDIMRGHTEAILTMTKALDVGRHSFALLQIGDES